MSLVYNILFIPVCTLIFLIVIKLYLIFTKGVCTCKNSLIGKTVLLTGGNTGIGYCTAINLAHRGARLIITSENEKDVQRAKDDIIKITGNPNIIGKYLDFRSFKCIRSFVEDVKKTEEKIDILINNAGGAGFTRMFTEDGIIPNLQINYFGPFLLTNLLIDLLKKSESGRIINVTSKLSLFGYFDLNNINVYPNTRIPELTLYNRSKLFSVYTTWELSARLKDTGITVNCVHPGVVNTTIFYRSRSWWNSVLQFVANIYFKTPEEGAQTTIHLAVSDKVSKITGEYFEDCRASGIFIKKDLTAIAAIWYKSIELTKLKPEETIM